MQKILGMVKILQFHCRRNKSDPWSGKFHMLIGVEKQTNKKINEYSVFLLSPKWVVYIGEIFFQCSFYPEEVPVTTTNWQAAENRIWWDLRNTLIKLSNSTAPIMMMWCTEKETCLTAIQSQMVNLNLVTRI